jgi:putative phosphoesterase
MRIGVISDTHGHLDPSIATHFEGVDHILHAGDIGYASLILELEGIAPVTAVVGNNDADLNFKETEIVLLAGQKFLIHHIIDVRAPHERIRQRIEREKPDVVVFGHSHKTHQEILSRTLYLNPGYAGRPRFNLRRTVALLHCEPGGIRAEFKLLEP